MRANSAPPPTPLARAGRNLVLKSIGEISARLCFAALFIWAARVLGADDYGRYSYAASLAALALIGMDLGLNTLFVRDGARQRERVPYYAGSLLLLKGAMALTVLAGIWVFCLAMGYPAAQTGLILTVALAASFWGVAELGVAGLNALERMDSEALVKTVSRLAALAACGSLLLAGAGLWGLVAGLVAANALGAGLSLWKLGQKTGFTTKLERSFFAYLFRESLPLALTNIFILVYFRVDVVMLELMGKGFTEIGWYAAGIRIVDALGVIPGLVAGAMLPVLSSLAPAGREQLMKLYGQGQRLLLILGLPAAVGLWAVRDQAALLVYGPQFTETGRAFFWLAPMLAFLFLNFLQLGLLTASGLQRLCAVATGVCVIINVGLNWFLIPAHGFEGAAAATLITELAISAQCWWFIRRHLGRAGLLKNSFKPLIATGVMAICLWLVSGWPTGAVIICGGAVYAAALLLLKGITVGEVKELIGMVRRRG